MTRCAVAAAVGIALATAGAWASGGLADPGLPGTPATRYVPVTVTVPSRYHGRGPEWWANQDAHARRSLAQGVLRQRSLFRSLRIANKKSRVRWAPTVSLAIAYARAVYGVDQTRRSKDTPAPVASNVGAKEQKA